MKTKLEIINETAAFYSEDTSRRAVDELGGCSYLRDYLAGAVEGLKAKLNEGMKEFVTRGNGDDSGRGLILANDNRIAEYMAEHYPPSSLGRARFRNSGGNSSSGAYRQGVKDGGSVAAGATGKRMIK